METGPDLQPPAKNPVPPGKPPSSDKVDPPPAKPPTITPTPGDSSIKRIEDAEFALLISDSPNKVRTLTADLVAALNGRLAKGDQVPDKERGALGAKLTRALALQATFEELDRLAEAERDLARAVNRSQNRGCYCGAEGQWCVLRAGNGNRLAWTWIPQSGPCGGDCERWRMPPPQRDRLPACDQLSRENRIDPNALREDASKQVSDLGTRIRGLRNRAVLDRQLNALRGLAPRLSRLPPSPARTGSLSGAEPVEMTVKLRAGADLWIFEQYTQQNNKAARTFLSAPLSHNRPASWYYTMTVQEGGRVRRCRVNLVPGGRNTCDLAGCLDSKNAESEVRCTLEN